MYYSLKYCYYRRIIIENTVIKKELNEINLIAEKASDLCKTIISAMEFDYSENQQIKYSIVSSVELLLDKIEEIYDKTDVLSSEIT
ncbi:hypothetical protein J6G99_07755 [bacterium]|nr:hypothetical protein [bacterium]